MATRKASGNGARRDRAGAARAVGRLGRPRRVQQHDPEGRAVVPARGPPVQGVPRRPLRPGAALRHPRARDGLDHERHHPARRHPGLRRHVPGLQRLHASGGPARGADEAAGHLRLDARLDRPRRGRPDPPADRAPRGAARHPRPRRGAAGRRQRDRGRLAHDPRAHRPARRAVPHPAEPAGLGPRRSSRSAEGTARGGYVLADASDGQPQVIIDRHRLRGAAGRRGPRAARGRGHPHPGRVDAVRRVVPRAGHVLPAAGAARAA